jgi:hypothetical protein
MRVICHFLYIRLFPFNIVLGGMSHKGEKLLQLIRKCVLNLAQFIYFLVIYLHNEEHTLQPLNIIVWLNMLIQYVLVNFM